MCHRRTWLLLMLVIGLGLSTLTPVAAQPPRDENKRADGAVVDGKLLRPAATVETGRFVVEFTRQARLGRAERIDDFAARGEFVVDALQRTARTSQRRAAAMARRAGATVEQYWFQNAMVVAGDVDVAALAALPGVATVRRERQYPINRPVSSGEAIAVAAGDPEWGVDRIGAPAAWDQGVTGSGIVVASLDSGVDYTHPALVSQYRGNNGDGTFTHDYNWFDASGDCPTPDPCDLFGHGTHTMGTMVGGDGPGPFAPDIGVAPGATWITVSCGPFFCSDAQLMAAGQWLLAPTDANGENPDPGLRPDIVNNSWGGGPGDDFFLDTVDTWRAAGIVPVFASGNPGPACGAGGSPGDYPSAFSVGATDIDDVIADFSGRGPSAFGKINPDVSAPGVDVLSSVPGGGYEAFSGTSMATPHTVGALALMMSAGTELIGDVDGVTGALAATAVDIVDLGCGGDTDGDPNNVYGEGRIDAAAAVDVVVTGGLLTGVVTDTGSGEPIAGARITADNGERQFSTSSLADGSFSMLLAAGEYLVTAGAFGYETAAAPGVVIETDLTTTQDLALTALPRFTLTGTVYRAERQRPAPDVVVRALGVPVDPVTTDRNGRYSLTLPLGTYTIEADGGACLTSDTAEVELFDDASQDFGIVQVIDDFGHGCEAIPFRWVDADQPTTLYGDDVMGRLPLPFDFPFYGESYDDVFIGTNGYLSFTDELFGFSEYFPSPIPSSQPPNAAIYALWQDLWVIDDGARVEWDTVGRPDRRGRDDDRPRTTDRRDRDDAERRERNQRRDRQRRTGVVVEYSGISNLGTETPTAEFEIQLWSDGTIDLLYGPGADDVRSGGGVFGIENAAGDDALPLSLGGETLEGRAWRITEVPTGVVSGIVTNANDGSPVAGARVTAQPGGRTATTDGEGRYTLRLVPGEYALSAAADDYEDASTTVRLHADQELTRDFVLAAPAAEVSPAAIDAAVTAGSTTQATVTVANVGSATLDWQVRERDRTGPAGGGEARQPNISVTRSLQWAPTDVPRRFRPSYVASPTFDGDLDVIITDPAGDAPGVDVTLVHGASDETEVSMQLDFTETTPMEETVGLVFVDTDQDAATGLPPEAINGLPTQDIGMEYFVDLFDAAFGFGYVVDAVTFEFVGEIAVETVGQSYRFDVPTELLGGDDGSVDVALVVGDFFGPTDWAPDVGHGTVEPFRDAPWMDPFPTQGSVAPGESAEVTVTLGGGDIEPGAYAGDLVFLTDDPVQSQHTVTISLTVTPQ